MNFDLSAEHELLRDTVRQFALEKIAPVAEELDREKRFPYEIVAELAELGLMGMTIPEEYGGAGSDTLFALDNSTTDILFGGLGTDVAHCDLGDSFPDTDIEQVLYE